MKNLFDPELRTAAIVPRWSIVRTHNSDFIAVHQFFVALYAESFADLLQWQGPRHALLYSALVHDMDETITGDVVSPVKREIIDANRAEDFINVKMRERLPTIMNKLDAIEDALSDSTLQEIGDIIKLADRLDAALFLVMEGRLGNHTVKELADACIARLMSTWLGLKWPTIDLHRTWQTAILPSIEAHHNQGGRGV